LEDLLVLGSPKKTSEVTILDYKFVAQDVALRTKCCSKKIGSVKGCGSRQVVSLRIEPTHPHTFSTAYSSSTATPLIVNQSICTSG